MDMPNRRNFISLKMFILFCEDYSEIKFSENKKYIRKVNKLIKTTRNLLELTLRGKCINYNNTSVNGLVRLISSTFDKEEKIDVLMDAIYIELNGDYKGQSSLDDIKDIGIQNHHPFKWGFFNEDKVNQDMFFIKNYESESNLLYKVNDMSEINKLFSKIDKETDFDVKQNIIKGIEIFLLWYLFFNYIKILLETVEES